LPGPATLVLKSKLGLTCEVGAIQENVKKNRYKDVLPYDQSRVVLSLPVADCDSDYINASFIQGATKNRSYIASQGPLSSTVTDFWRMIWQYDVKVIVMACREVEMGKKKCQRYWTPLHQSAAFGPFTVCNVSKDTRSVVQYHFLSWPDHDVPSEAQGVLSLLELARTTQGTHTSPLLVHCSAGCGRTGVICALDYIHDLLVTKQIAADFSIMKVVLELRKQRTTAVQTKVGEAAMNDTYAVVNKSPSPSSHHYDNNLGEAALYSTIKPRAKRAAMPIHTASANEMDGERCASLGNDDFHLTSGEQERGGRSETDGFNCRVQKPRGPRDLPAGWRQL
uniref:protein-tyrosine-phosphatase n=1 Tax=Takifugu rubripes TaxID=31033 RepID=H2UAJ0_TAKRU